MLLFIWSELSVKSQEKNITFDKLHTESTQNIVQASYDQGVPRYLHMSANGTRDAAITRYHQTKWAAEEVVRQSNLTGPSSVPR